jgi:MFS family permease
MWGPNILSQWTQLGWKALKPHHWVAFAVFGWGIISTLQSAVTSRAGLMVCRAGLGVVEAMYGPGVPLYLSYFYPREKLGLRTGIFISSAALANAYGGVLAYGITQAKS